MAEQWWHTGKKCEDCRYCSNDFLCRRNPPTYVHDDSPSGRWPEVEADDWCGEFSPDSSSEEGDDV